MTAGDPFPSNEEMREATTELVALVRSRLLMRYYGGERWWSMFIAGTLVRMTDTVESLIVLMAEDLSIDGRTTWDRGSCGWQRSATRAASRKRVLPSD